jgi:N-acetylmuramoyl-L-alanine amidase
MKSILKLTLVLLTSICLGFQTSDEKKIRIIIDVGHGGNDHGSNSEGFYEKDILLDISNYIKKHHVESEVEFIFTRENDVFISLNDRIKFINKIKPDLVISLHTNFSNNPTTSGIEAFVATSSKSKQFAIENSELLLKLLSESSSFKNRGVKEAPFMILEKSEVPSITIELGFLSNSEDREWITDKHNQEIIAKSIIDFAIQL